MALIPTIIKDDWTGLNRIIRKLASLKLGPTASPTFAGLTLTGLTAARLMATDGSKGLASVDLISWVAGTTDEINIADDGDGTITIGIADPLIVGKGGTGLATLTDHGILLGSGTGAVTPLAAATDGQLPIGSTGADPVLANLTGTANRVTVTNAAGSITLSGPQDIHTGASPTFTDLTLSAPSNIYALSHDSFADFVADEHFLQTAITKVSTALSTGLLKVTTGTGALSVITDSSANWDAAYTHVSNNGSDHSYINQDVTTTGEPTFANLVLTSAFFIDSASPSNIGIGFGALLASPTGTFNLGIGQDALGKLTTGWQNVGIGELVMKELTTGWQNLGIGANSLRLLMGSASTNMALGATVQYNNRVGEDNVGIGYSALYSNTAGGANIGIGRNALWAVKPTGAAITAYADNLDGKTQVTSVAHGQSNGQSLKIAGSTSYNGNYLIEQVTADTFVIQTAFVADDAKGWWFYDGDGAANIGIGYYAGDNITSGSFNIIMGYSVDADSATADYQLNIGGLLKGDMTAASLRLDCEGSLMIKEKAAALADMAGYGQLWVKNTTPCELWFTRDDGTDVQVA